MSVPASPSGSRASHEAAKASSPEASIPNAGLPYWIYWTGKDGLPERWWSAWGPVPAWRRAL